MQNTRRAILFRLAALLLGLLPFVVAEFVLTLTGVARPDYEVDPFVGFDDQRPLFVLNDEGSRYEIARGRYLCFVPDDFSAQKAPNEFRVFCLGGSTVQGRPYSIESSFTKWLELSLQAADPERQFKVVNCGGISYASYRLVPILEEVLRYDPDLILLYTGHNEFLEDRTYGKIKRRGPIRKAILRQATRLSTFRWAWSRWNARQTASELADHVVTLPVEVDARLDHRGGLELYHRDTRWRNNIVSHFHFNLRRMIELCREAGVPVWLYDPVCNLRGTPPFKSQVSAHLTDKQVDDVERLRNEASGLYASEMSAAIALLEEASAIDPQNAGLAYDLAKCYEAQGLTDKAKEAYVRAKDEDVCPLRMIEPMRDAIHQVARQTNTPLIEVNRLFESVSRYGIPGGSLLVDHVHPSIAGHQMIAALTMELAIESGIVDPDPSWVERRDEAYRQQTASLDHMYYLQGQRRLAGLREWAAGRAGQGTVIDSDDTR